MNKKIIPLSRLKKILRPLRKRKKIVFTNGCFDILHLGHVKVLREAEAKGDILVVGLNTDTSAKRLKGNTRPINPQKDRAEVLAGLESVDYVVLFDDDTPYRLIQALKPDVLVKGGDWPKEKIVGADFVMSYGGKVSTIPYVKDRSTTGIIKKITRKR